MKQLKIAFCITKIQVQTIRAPHTSKTGYYPIVLNDDDDDKFYLE